jgi:hypothetical protein
MHPKRETTAIIPKKPRKILPDGYVELQREGK